MIPSSGTVALAVIDPLLCLTFVAGAPAMVAVVRRFAHDATDASGRYLDVQGSLAARLVDAVAGARSIAAAGTTDREIRRVLASLPELHRHGLALWRSQANATAQQALVVPLLQIAVLAVAGAQVARGRITPGEMLAASQYVVLASTLGAAVPAVGRLARARAASRRVAELLDLPGTRYGTRALPAGPGRLEFRGVTVRAGDRAVLESVDLTVPGGALLAVVGPSGSGKSVLGALAGRLVEADAGEVVLDGVAVAELDRRELRRAVTYGFERPALIGETVGRAIAFGGRQAGEDDVVAAARASRADEFIRRLPGRYATPLTAAPMSGGERQRVGLARVFAHPARVVVFDDVAASLDTVTEHHILRVLTEELSGTTRLIVANRASTAARADLVVWLEGGRVRATAPHRLLWAVDAYRAVFGDATGRGPLGGLRLDAGVGIAPVDGAAT